MKYIVVITIFLFSSAQFNPARCDDPDFERIFDGKSLSGWVPTKGAENAWEVKDGILVGTGDKGRGYLTYTKNKNVADLEMKFSYRFPGKGNSGVSIRAVVDETGKRDFRSYHADLGHKGIGGNVMGAWDFHTPGRREHRCFRGDSLVINKDDTPRIKMIPNALTADDIHANGWNQVHIIAIDNYFKLIINNKLSSEFTELLPIDKRLDKGMIQLQLHDPGMVVEFKDIQLKVIK